MKNDARIFLATVLVWLGLIFSAAAQTTNLTAAGEQLAQTLDGMQVEKLWLPGVHVDWRTGEPDGKVYRTTNSHTHCSAFAASAAEKLGVYLLRPPEHSAELLANAQQDWLRGAGTNQGWQAVATPLAAQALANAGQLVVVTCKNANPAKPGHIAIVRPSAKSAAEILADGPDIIQAGGHNYARTTVKIGFKNHPGAFAGGELLYFSHAFFTEKTSTLNGATEVKSPHRESE